MPKCQPGCTCKKHDGAAMSARLKAVWANKTLEERHAHGQKTTEGMEKAGQALRPREDRVYRRNHMRVIAVRGKAETFQCVAEECDRIAQDWATIRGRSGDHPDDYQAMCKKCHASYDYDQRYVGRTVTEEHKKLISARNKENYANNPQRRENIRGAMKDVWAQRSVEERQDISKKISETKLRKRASE